MVLDDKLLAPYFTDNYASNRNPEREFFCSPDRRQAKLCESASVERSGAKEHTSGEFSGGLKHACNLKSHIAANVVGIVIYM